MKTHNKKARFLFEERREYYGTRSTKRYKRLANRIERRAAKQETRNVQ